MATRTAQCVTLDDGTFRVTLTYDDVTLRVSRVDVVNASGRDRTVSVSHPASGQVFSVPVPTGQSLGRNIPGNRTLRLSDSREVGGNDDWPTFEVI